MTAPLNWRKHLRIHPAAELFPLMAEVDPAALKELAEDIKNHGLRGPIVGWSSNGGHFLLDGRNRLDAMALLGLLYETADHHVGVKKWTGKQWSDQPGGRIGQAFNSCEIRNFYDGDPYAIALSLNVHRRHLTTEQKRDLIAKVIKANPEKSNRQIADQVKVSHPHVAKVRAELEKTGDVETVSTSIDTKGRKQPRRRIVEPKEPFDPVAFVLSDEPAKRKVTAKDFSQAADIIVDAVIPRSRSQTYRDETKKIAADYLAQSAEIGVEQRRAEMAQLATNAPDDLIDQAIRLVEQMTADQRRGFIGRLWEKGLLTEFTPPGDDSIPEFLLRGRP